MTFNAEAAADFLIRQFAYGLTNVVAIAPDRAALLPGAAPIIGGTFDVKADRARLTQFVAGQKGHRNVYFTPNRVAARLAKKAAKGDLASIVVAHVDIDPRTGYDREEERERIRGLIASYPVQPHILIDSGNGYQALWRLGNPLPAAQFAEDVETVNTHLSASLGGDHCQSVDHLLRLPYTDNLPDRRKLAKGRTIVPATVVYEHDGTLSLDTIAASYPAHTAKFAELIATDEKLRYRWHGGTDGLTDTSRSGLDMSVLSLLAKHGYSKEDAGAILREYPHGKAREEDARYIDLMWDKINTELRTRSTRTGSRPVGKAELCPLELSEAIADMNRTYAIVQDGSRAFVLEEKPDGSYQRIRISDFRTLEANRTYSDGKRERPLADAWLKHPLRREFRNGIVFLPGEGQPPGAYNIWKGFAVAPSPGSCQKFLDHVHENVCSGDDELFQWLMGWIAQMLQFPQRKLGTSVCLIGEQGTGKTLVGSVIGRLLGPHYRLVAREGLVTGRFNSHLEPVLLLHCDEAFFADDKASANVLKDLITSDTIQIEAKGRDLIERPNYIRVFMTTNSDWAIQAAPEERRMCVIRVSNAHRQDREYFSAIMRELETENGYAALLDLLLKWPVDEASLRAIPRTDALAEQKMFSLSPDMTWWLDVLERGILPGDLDGSGQCPNEVLHQHYIAHARDTGVQRRASETALGTLLRRVCPGIVTTKRSTTDHCTGRSSVQRMRRFPPLEDCRAAFAHFVGRTDPWEGPSKWGPDSVLCPPDADAF